MFKAGPATPGREGVSAETARQPSHPVVLVENRSGHGRAVIVCDHASNHVPAGLAALGLATTDFARHIAWDPGALGIARTLAARLDAPLVAGGVSRLVIDCNRDPSAADSIPQRSEDTAVPGNAGLAPGDRQWRVASVYEPFHDAIDAVLAEKAAPVAVIGIHTFTPVYKGERRPWHVGILFDRDRRLAAPLLADLSADPKLVVGANEPYSPADRVYHTLDRHAQQRGWPSVMIEVRNDLAATQADETAWGERLAEAIARALDGALETEPDNRPHEGARTS
jgi:predicted N-formylglutamate amidohydrolase